MSRFYWAALLAIVILLPLALGGCAGVLVVGGLGAAAGGGYAAAQERGVNGTIDDISLKNDVDRALLQTNPPVQEAVNTTVYDGRVLLTGRLASPEMRATAERAARATPGLRALYDEIEVASSDGLWDGAKDAWIATRVRSELILDPDVRSGNYTIQSENGSVYLIGSARSQFELDRAAQVARYVPGVKRVVSYVEVRSGVPVAAGAAGLPPAPARPQADQRGGAPSAPIEVQRL